MKRFFKTSFYIILCIALLCSALLLGSCKKDGENDTDAPAPIGENSIYAGLDLDEYVTLCEYANQDLSIKGTSGTREDMEKAVKSYIFTYSQIKKYPEAAVNYYIEQEKTFYMHLAEGDTDEYEALLSEAGMSDEDFEKLAKRYVAEDLIFYAITKHAGISITDEEKSSLFDKYADEYVKLYGYSAEYIKDNMSELIYDAMLFDKTMEYLIENNNFKK